MLYLCQIPFYVCSRLPRSSGSMGQVSRLRSQGVCGALEVFTALSGEKLGDHGLRLLSSEKMIIGQFTVFVYERSKPRGVVTAGSSSSRLHRLRIF
jgi:hypothetical protein